MCREWIKILKSSITHEWIKKFDSYRKHEWITKFDSYRVREWIMSSNSNVKFNVLYIVLKHDNTT